MSKRLSVWSESSIIAIMSTLLTLYKQKEAGKEFTSSTVEGPRNRCPSLFLLIKHATIDDYDRIVHYLFTHENYKTEWSPNHINISERVVIVNL